MTDNAITVVGADWCHGCQTVLEALEDKDIQHRYLRIPPGQAGWELVEALTGRRALPVIFYNAGHPKKFLQMLNKLGETHEVSE